MDPLLQLTSAITAYSSQLTPAKTDMTLSLTHLAQSCAMARPQSFVPPSHRYAALVTRALDRDSSAVEAITQYLRPVHESLPWVYHYSPRSAEEDVGDRIAFAELIGPDGPLGAPNCRIGFTVMAENTLYPMHVHPAVELYLVLAGTARWQTPAADRRVPPGHLVLHRSNEPHSMRTSDEPMLALWGWSGDIDAPAAYCT